ncbi:MAG: hypothetical protein AAF570_12325 [Bacteroidota bacterium]
MNFLHKACDLMIVENLDQTTADRRGKCGRFVGAGNLFVDVAWCFILVSGRRWENDKK